MLATVANVLLGLALLASAAAKLVAPARSQAALATFGLRSAAVRRGAWAVAIAVETGLGVGVAVGAAAAAYAAAILMLVFAVLLARALRTGKTGQPCGCLGPRSRVTPASLGRALLLAAAYALLPLVPDTDPTTEGWLALGLAVALAAIVALAVLVLALAREVGDLRLALPPQLPLEIPGEGPPLGERAHAAIERFAVARGARAGACTADPHGGRALRRSEDPRFALAVFTSESCPMCQALAPAVESLKRDPLLTVEVFDEHADADVWRALDIPGSPYAVVLTLDGIALAQGTFNSARQLEALVAAGEAREREPVRA